jgi:DNA-binding NarL/FixJ family response regulator
VAILDIGMPLLNGIEATRRSCDVCRWPCAHSRHAHRSEYRAHILQKLGLRNTSELVLYAVRRGMIA